MVPIDLHDFVGCVTSCRACGYLVLTFRHLKSGDQWEADPTAGIALAMILGSQAGTPLDLSCQTFLIAPFLREHKCPVGPWPWLESVERQGPKSGHLRPDRRHALPNRRA